MQSCIGMDVSCDHFHAAIYAAQGKVACLRDGRCYSPDYALVGGS